MEVVRLRDWGAARALRDFDRAAASGNPVFGLDRCKLARPERLELPTLWFEARCSIQLSYGRAKTIISPASPFATPRARLAFDAFRCSRRNAKCETLLSRETFLWHPD